MDKAEYLNAFTANSDAFISAAASVDLNSPVAACPDWSVADLVAHTGFVWGFAAANVAAAGEKTMPSDPKPPEDQGKLLEWAASVRATALEALSAAEPNAPAWTFASNNQTAGFWQRRMVQETAVHLFDVQSSADSVEPIPAQVATDGIDEYLHVGLQFSSGRPNRTYPTQSLHIHCTDTPGEWTVVADEDNKLTITHEHGKGDAAVRGEAEQLLLWLWGRSDKVEIFGDADLATTWQELAP